MIGLWWVLACTKGDAPPLTLDTQRPEHSEEVLDPTSGCVDGTRGLPADGCVSEAACAWTGSEGYGFFGMSVAAGGDLDGDGVPDVAFGSPGATAYDAGGVGLNDAGQVTVVSGASLREGPVRNLGVWSGAEASLYHGSAVVMPGDLNGDGVHDLVAGALSASPGGVKFAGQLSVLWGQAGGYGATDTGAEVQLVTASTWTGVSEYARVGHALAPAGDVNGDGLADLWASGELKRLVSDSETWSRGQVALILGRSTWPAQASLGDADALLDGDSTNGGAGQALAGDADFDGDGYKDVAVGALWGQGYRGSVFWLPGSATGFAGQQTLGTQGARVDGVNAYDVLGYTLAAGDFNGDGFDDLAVGVPLDDTRQDAAGRVVIYAGAPEVFTAGPEPLGSWLGEFDDHQLGSGLEAGGDLTGDGVEDLVVGAVNAWRGLVTKGGRAYVVAGRADGWPTDQPAEELPVRLHGAGVKDYLGSAQAIADLDGDGVGDLVLASGYTNVGSTTDAGGAWLFWGEGP